MTGVFSSGNRARTSKKFEIRYALHFSHHAIPGAWDSVLRRERRYCVVVGSTSPNPDYVMSNESLMSLFEVQLPFQRLCSEHDLTLSRLDSPFVVFHGEPYEADPIDLAGSLILNNPDHMNVRSIKIKFEGKWRVQWLVEPSTSTMTIRDKGTIISEEKVLYPAEGLSTSVAHKIAPGFHEWRFSFQMPSHLPESVEGLPGSYIVYDLTAEIDRGYMSKNLIATKHVRVIRTLGRDLTDTVPMPYVCRVAVDTASLIEKDFSDF